MFKIAVASNDGDEVSESLAGCLLFMIYNIEEGRIVSCEKRAQILGIPATVRDCDLVVARHCPDSVASLLAGRGIQTITDQRRSAARAVHGIMKNMGDEVTPIAMEKEQATTRVAG